MDGPAHFAPLRGATAGVERDRQFRGQTGAAAIDGMVLLIPNDRTLRLVHRKMEATGYNRSICNEVMSHETP